MRAFAKRPAVTRASSSKVCSSCCPATIASGFRSVTWRRPTVSASTESFASRASQVDGSRSPSSSTGRVPGSTASGRPRSSSAHGRPSSSGVTRCRSTWRAPKTWTRLSFSRLAIGGMSSGPIRWQFDRRVRICVRRRRDSTPGICPRVPSA